MGVINVEALNLARRVAIYNGDAIFVVKHSLMERTLSTDKELGNSREKYFILIKESFPKTDVDSVLADFKTNKNHDLTKLDVSLIYDIFVESLSDEAPEVPL